MPVASVTDFPAKDLDRMLQVNVVAPFALAAAAIPVIRWPIATRRSTAAWLVIVSSMAGQ